MTRSKALFCRKTERSVHNELSKLTPREKEVLHLMADGLTCKEIALNLYLSPHTIVSHKKNLIDKLEARNSFQLAVIATKLGFI